MDSVEIRDKIDTVKDLINACILALGNKEMGSDYTNDTVMSVLNFHVIRQLESINEELKEL